MGMVLRQENCAFERCSIKGRNREKKKRNKPTRLAHPQQKTRKKEEKRYQRDERGWETVY